MHQTNIPQRTILQQKWPQMCTFLLQNVTLRDMAHTHSGICEMGLFHALGARNGTVSKDQIAWYWYIKPIVTITSSLNNICKTKYHCICKRVLVYVVLDETQEISFYSWVILNYYGTINYTDTKVLSFWPKSHHIDNIASCHFHNFRYSQWRRFCAYQMTFQLPLLFER